MTFRMPVSVAVARPRPPVSIRICVLAVIATLVAGTGSVPAQAADGALDASFDSDGKLTTAFGSTEDIAKSIAIQSDGKLIAGGYSIMSGTGQDFALARYNTNGSLDTSFDTDGKVTTSFGSDARTDLVNAIVIQFDGKIVAGGSAADATTDRFALTRYNTDGSLDTSFGTDGKVTTAIGARDIANAIAIQSDGKIVAAGSTHRGSDRDFALARYNTDGSIDGSFGGLGTDDLGTVTTAFGVTEDVANSIAIQSDGKILAGGSSIITGTGTVFALARYNIDGSLDTSFDSDGTLTTSFTTEFASSDVAKSIAIQPDGKIVAGGFHRGSSTHFALARYNTDGSLDTSFDSDGKLTTAVGSTEDVANSIAIQPDGKVVAGGSSIMSGSGQDFALARYHTDGSLDTSFDSDGKLTTAFSSTEDVVNAIALQPDGKIVAAGHSPNGFHFDFALARYGSTGSHLLTVTKDGTGSGSVTSDPAGIDCGADCTESYADEESVTLTATPAGGSSFTGWSGGGCNGTGTCTVDLSADRDVTAAFDLIPAPTVLSTTPADGALDVAPESIVSATFDMPLDTFTLTLTSSKGREVSGTTTCDSPCTIVTFTPTRELAGRTTYTASITGTAESGTTTETWSFTTGRKGGKPG